jgi:membrane protease YdiL (CAAX protease family)
VATSRQLQPIDLITGELPFLLAGLLGVGLLIRRSPGATMARLGFVRPAWWHVVLGLAAAGIFFAFSSGVDLAAQHLTPDLARKIGSANDRLYSQLNTPLGVATIALAAGIGEETLFRGALQPRMGLLWTAILFAAVHTQYGLSLDALAVLILAIGLGLLRRYANTTTSLICHVTYNAVVGFQLAASMLVPALVLEVGLLALLVVAFARRERTGEPRATT